MLPRCGGMDSQCGVRVRHLVRTEHKEELWDKTEFNRCERGGEGRWGCGARFRGVLLLREGMDLQWGDLWRHLVRTER